MISHAVRQQLQEKLEQARRLIAHQPPDRDRVHALLADCLTADPGNTIYIDAVLQNLRDQPEKRGLGVWLGGWLRNRDFERAAAAGDWPQVLQLAAAELARDPREVTVLRTLAEACAALDLPHAELRYLQAALDAEPANLATLRQLARALARLGEYDDSRAAWQQILDRTPGDAEATRLLNELGGKAAEARAGVSAVAAPPDPTDIDAVLQAAAVFIQAAQFDEAEELLSQSLARAGGELRLRERLEELTVERSRHKLEIARQRAAAEPSDTARDLVRQLRDEVNRLELGLFHSRTERYPKRGDVRLELAIRLKRAGNFSGAIEQLHPLREQPPFAAAALLELGECTQHLRQFERALDFYRQALHQLGDASESESARLALYRAGVLATAMQQPTEARDYLARLVAVDPSFKDAQQRLDKIAEICDKT